MSSLLAVKQKNMQACLISLDFFKAYDETLNTSEKSEIHEISESEIQSAWSYTMGPGGAGASRKRPIGRPPKTGTGNRANPG